MDLYDILIAKKLAGGSGGGGGGNVETATIEIAVTDGAPTITSGAFPDWCTSANNDCIYGGLAAQNIIIGTDHFDDTRFGKYEIFYYESKTIIAFSSGGDEAELAIDLTSLMIDGANITSGSLTVTLIYMPN